MSAASRHSALSRRPNKLNMWRLSAALAFSVFSVTAGELPPPVLEPVIREGDTEIPGLGLVTGFGSFAVNDSGDWLVEVDTEVPDQDSNTVLLLNGVLQVREGLPLVPGPPGAILDGFDSVTLDNNGRAGFNFFLDGVTDDSGVYTYLDPTMSFDDGTVLVLQEGEDVPDFPPATPALGFFDVKINDAGDLFVTASIDAAAIPSTVDRALYILTPDPAGGIASSTLIAAEGDVLPGQAVALTDFGTSFTETAFNDLGHALFAVDIPGGLDAIYLFDGGLTEIAQEGDPSPVAGRNWQSLTSTAVALNDAGSYVIRGQLDGDASSSEILVRDGAKLVQEGDVLSDVAPFALTDIAGPVWITESGDVLWYGQWDDPDTSFDTGIFLNDRLLIQEGVTMTADGQTLTRLWGLENGFALSDSGNFALVRGEIVLDGLYLIDLGGLFADGFESGDTSSWSSSTGGP